MKTIRIVNKNRDEYLNQLLELLRIPSVSADPTCKEGMIKAANWLKDHMSFIGLENCAIYPTSGHPIVFADKIQDKNMPTVLVYGHYDVQPPDPLELWNTPPFEPIIQETSIHPSGAIFARGSCDDKGQLFMHLKAVEAMLEANELDCNVKILLEGEEEVGSDNLEQFLRENMDLLACDVVLISDSSILANDLPSISIGLRGLSYVEVEVTGPNRDLHSGVYGGGVANPINVLCEMIASLRDKNKKIIIPGFYDNVVDLSKSERKAIESIPFSLEDYQEGLDVNSVEGEKGYSTLERTSSRPTLDVNGIWGGYIGEGAKTVLPSKAFAKISMRLVPNQTDDEITKLFTEHFEKIAPPSVRVKVTPHHGGLPVITPTNTAEYKAASMAMKKTYGKEPIPVRGGGSIPIVSLFESILDVKTVLMGFGLDSDDIHSPNEHFGLFNFYKGIETIPYFYKYYAELKS